MRISYAFDKIYWVELPTRFLKSGKCYLYFFWKTELTKSKFLRDEINKSKFLCAEMLFIHHSLQIKQNTSFATNKAKYILYSSICLFCVPEVAQFIV